MRISFNGRVRSSLMKGSYECVCSAGYVLVDVNCEDRKSSRSYMLNISNIKMMIHFRRLNVNNAYIVIHLKLKLS